jgi:hypothetical protein
MTDTASPTAGTPPPAGQGLVLRGAVVDLVVGICLALLALWFWVEASTFAEVDGTGIGAATFPRAIATLFGLGAIMLVGRAIARLCSWGADTITITERPGYVLAGMALLVAFPALMTWLGYYLGSALWMPALFFVAGYRKPLGIVLYTAAFLLFAKVVFEMILGVRLP